MNPVEVKVPNAGVEGELEVIEVCVSVGDLVALDNPIVVLESNKATIEVPSPVAGRITEISVKVGSKVVEGDALLSVVTEKEAVENEPQAPEQQEQAAVEQVPEVVEQPTPIQADVTPEKAAVQPAEPDPGSEANVHAGPAVRKIARELGADLQRVAATGPKGRILKQDLDDYIKSQLKLAQMGGAVALPVVKLPDFSSFGEIETRPLDKIKRLTAENMLASWQSVPQVTQFDEADITDLEAFRQQHKAAADEKGLKLTLLAFLLKSSAHVLRALPQFNSALDLANQKVIYKNYVHLGFAVDTEHGLVVPVIRDVDKKSIWHLAEECQVLAAKAKERKLTPGEMQGGCFTLSSLGSIGGTAFTPIVNAPEVAILGVSKAQHKPVFDGAGFVPRLMLPLSLSYDHRAVNGAEAARFTSLLAKVLGDLRELLL